MIRYAYAGRKYPRYQPDGQGVFNWASVGQAGFVPVAPGTHKRPYHNWTLIGGPYNSCFVWQNAGSAGFIPPAPTPVTPTPETGGTRRRIGVRVRQRILLRIDGVEHELSSLAEVVALIKAAKKDVPVIAREKAAEIILAGKRIGDARKEEKPIEVVAAPSSVRDIIEDRIDEMQRFYWARVAAQVKALEDDDDEMMMLL